MQTKGRSLQRSGTPESKIQLDATGIGTPNLGTSDTECHSLDQRNNDLHMIHRSSIERRVHLWCTAFDFFTTAQLKGSSPRQDCVQMLKMDFSGRKETQWYFYF